MQGARYIVLGRYQCRGLGIQVPMQEQVGRRYAGTYAGWWDGWVEEGIIVIHM